MTEFKVQVGKMGAEGVLTTEWGLRTANGVIWVKTEGFPASAATRNMVHACYMHGISACSPVSSLAENATLF